LKNKGKLADGLRKQHVSGRKGLDDLKKSPKGWFFAKQGLLRMKRSDSNPVLQIQEQYIRDIWL
jgi:hypothetical protein